MLVFDVIELLQFSVVVESDERSLLRIVLFAFCFGLDKNRYQIVQQLEAAELVEDVGLLLA